MGVSEDWFCFRASPQWSVQTSLYLTSFKIAQIENYSCKWLSLFPACQRRHSHLICCQHREFANASICHAVVVHKFRHQLEETHPLAAIFQTWSCLLQQDKPHPVGTGHSLGAPVYYPQKYTGDEKFLKTTDTDYLTSQIIDLIHTGLTILLTWTVVVVLSQILRNCGDSCACRNRSSQNMLILQNNDNIINWQKELYPWQLFISFLSSVS